MNIAMPANLQCFETYLHGINNALSIFSDIIHYFENAKIYIYRVRELDEHLSNHTGRLSNRLNQFWNLHFANFPDDCRNCIMHSAQFTHCSA